MPAVPGLFDAVPALCPHFAAEKQPAAPLPCGAGTPPAGKAGPVGRAERRACRLRRGDPGPPAGVSRPAGPHGVGELPGAFPRGRAAGDQL